MIAFITGSRAYGEPTAKSDVDLVIRTDDATAAILRGLSDPVLQNSKDKQLVIRFGKLNIVVCTTDEQFAVWRIGTTFMQRMKQANGETYNWEQAKAVFDELRDQVGIKDIGDSGPKKHGTASGMEAPF